MGTNRKPHGKKKRTKAERKEVGGSLKKGRKHRRMEQEKPSIGA